MTTWIAAQLSWASPQMIAATIALGTAYLLFFRRGVDAHDRWLRSIKRRQIDAALAQIRRGLTKCEPLDVVHGVAHYNQLERWIRLRVWAHMVALPLWISMMALSVGCYVAFQASPSTPIPAWLAQGWLLSTVLFLGLATVIGTVVFFHGEPEAASQASDKEAVRSGAAHSIETGRPSYEDAPTPLPGPARQAGAARAAARQNNARE